MNNPSPISMSFLMLGALHEMEAHLEGALGRVGLSLAKFRTLSQLVEAKEPVPLGSLADRCSCVRSNMTQLVDRLEADGLVVTEVAPGLDLRRDVLDQAATPLRISDSLKVMDDTLFRAETLSLAL